jgi:hypothetical protein
MKVKGRMVIEPVLVSFGMAIAVVASTETAHAGGLSSRQYPRVESDTVVSSATEKSQHGSSNAPPIHKLFEQYSEAIGHETAVSEVMESYIPGNRVINGKVIGIRGSQIQVDIGNPKPLYLPLKPAIDKGLTFKEGDAIFITMNDHNAVVDYHHRENTVHGKGDVHHDVIHGELAEPLTVGLDKAVVRTPAGEQSYSIASRAKAKLGAIPMGVDAVFLRDETGQIVDAQLTSDSPQDAADHTKARLKGAHQQMQALFKGRQGHDRIKVLVLGEHNDRIMPFRPPLPKLDRLQANKDVVLLVDDEGYVVEVATPDVPVR